MRAESESYLCGRAEDRRLSIAGCSPLHRELSRLAHDRRSDRQPGAQQFEITVDGRLAGFVTYRRKPGIIAFIHTEIDPEFGGQGLGGKLISSGARQRAAEGVDVLPFCPFVNKYIAEHEQYLPLVPEDMRAQFGLPD